MLGYCSSCFSIPTLMSRYSRAFFWRFLYLFQFKCFQRMHITLFKNLAQNVVFEFWHFPPIFVLLKLTCLVTLFDRKLQVFKISPKWTIFGIFN